MLVNSPTFGGKLESRLAFSGQLPWCHPDPLLSPACHPLAAARARRMKRTGKAVALWALGLYVAALLAMIPVMDRWPLLCYNVGNYKWQQLRRRVAGKQDRPLVVMLGSSRVEVLFEAGRLDGLAGPDGKPLLAYNLGTPAAGPIHELRYVRDMLDAGIRPRLLLLEFLPLMLNEPHRGRISEENWTSAPWRTLSQMLAFWPYWSRPSVKLQDWLQARLEPWYLFRSHFQPWLLEGLFAGAPFRAQIVHDAWGHQIPSGFNAQQRTERLLLTGHYYAPSLRDLHLGEGPCRALRDLLGLCSRERIPVALVVTPESAVFRSWYRAQTLAPALRLLEELHQSFGVQIINAREWLAENDFHDGHHVTLSGAEAFTTRLLDELHNTSLAPLTTARCFVPARGER
jgi:hypothetical protein